MSSELERLLWQEVDGELGDEGHRRLGALLAADGKARQTADSVRRVANELRSLSLEEPPQELRAHIDRALREAREPRQPRRRAVLGFLQNLFEAPLVRRLAFVAGGVVMGALGYHLLQEERIGGGDLDVRELYGAMLPSDQGSAELLTLDLAGGAGRLQAHGAAPSLVLELWLEPGQPAELLLEAPSGLRLERFSPAGDWAGQLVVEGFGSPTPRTLKITGLDAGRHLLVAQPTRAGEPVELEVTSGEAVLLRHRLGPGRLEPASRGAPTNFPTPSGY
jgi:hypothetical protein